MQLQSFVGIFGLVAIAWLLSENRSVVKIKYILFGLALQLLVAVFLLKLPMSRNFFFFLNKVVMVIQNSCEAGTSFIFGYLGGGTLPFEATVPGATFIFATRALPLILVISALSSLFFYWRITPLVVRAFSFVLQKTLNIGGALAVSSAANVFVGMVEAPLLIRPYLKTLTRSELFAVMTCGMATIAGTVMVLYASVLNGVVPDAMGHILTASIISAPAAVMLAGIMVPPQGTTTSGDFCPPFQAKSTMDAITRGTTEGVALLINIIAMLLVFIALVSLANQILALLPSPGQGPITLQTILG
ncbi:MAG: nucleoside:proton symporter, partial [Desulfobulbaceae bacterium]|nr:nucleoside:proton symporter [Desulfobulbaceae bacterium]